MECDRELIHGREMFAGEVEMKPFFEVVQSTVFSFFGGENMGGIGLEKASGRGEPIADGGRMGAREGDEGPGIDFGILDARKGMGVVPVVERAAPFFIVFVFGADPAVVVDGSAGEGGAGVAHVTVVGDDGKEQPLHAPDRDVVADGANLAAVPRGGGGEGVCISIEMIVAEVKSFDARVVEMALHGGTDGGNVVFVEKLIAFEIEGPVASAIEQGNGFLLAVDEPFDAPAAIEVFIPLGGDDPDFRGANGADLRFGVIVAGAKSDDEFIDERQGGSDGFDKGKLKMGGVAKEGEGADFHKFFPI